MSEQRPITQVIAKLREARDLEDLDAEARTRRIDEAIAILIDLDARTGKQERVQPGDTPARESDA